MTERYRLMEAEKGAFPVPMMARALGVSRSGFYSWLRRPRPEPADPWAKAREAVRAEHEAAHGIPGARTLLALVGPRFPGITLYRVRRLMRELGIRGVCPHASRRTTVPDPDAPCIEQAPVPPHATPPALRHRIPGIPQMYKTCI